MRQYAHGDHLYITLDQQDVAELIRQKVQEMHQTTECEIHCGCATAVVRVEKKMDMSHEACKI